MAIRDFTNKNSGGGLGGWLGPLSILSSFVPGMQWVAPAIAGVSAVGSLVNGDIGGALLNGASAFSKLGGKGGGGSSSFDANLTPQLESDPLYLSRQLSDLNQAGGAASISGALDGVPDGLSDMGTRYVENRMQSPGFVSNLIGRDGGGYRLSDADRGRYDELLAQYGLSDMDWTGRQRKNGLGGGII
ncbi:MAG: hypothetical protein Q4C86_14140 [bacterium]|nr:hypothetical protein [bacterium]